MSTVLISNMEQSATSVIGMVDLSMLPDVLNVVNTNTERPRTTVKAGKFQSVEQAVGDDEATRNKWEEWRGACREAIAVRAQGKSKIVEERKWQLDASISILMGFDTTVIAATSDGKSFTYQVLAIVRQGGKCLVVAPLVALVWDQVGSEYMSATTNANTGLTPTVQVKGCESWGIKACALDSASLKDDPGLLIRAARGEYEVVFVTPEFIRADNPRFLRLTGHNTKQKSLFHLGITAIVVDESHLVFHWLVLSAYFGYPMWHQRC